MFLDPLFETLRPERSRSSHCVFAGFRQLCLQTIPSYVRGRRRKLLLASILSVGAWCVPSGNVLSQEKPEGDGGGDFVIQAQSETVEDEETTSSRRRRTQNSQDSAPTGNGSDAEEGIGGMMRIDHLFGETVGQPTGITPIEVMPYRLFDNDMWFGSARFFPNDKGRLGGNAGLGYRYFDDTITRVIGGSLWYDLDDTSRATFQQVGLSLETYGEMWDARANLYLPVGDNSEVLNSFVNPGSARYSGHSILFDQTTVSVVAMKGFDTEVGVPLPTEFGDKHDIRAYAGMYHFTESDVPDIWGWKTRLEVNVIPQVEVQIQGSGDDVYGTNLMVGVGWAYSGPMYAKPEQARKSPYGRMGEWVRRNYNIVSPEQRIVENDLRATNPTTGNEYVVQHVDSNATGSDGSVGDPFRTLAEAQAAGGDLILVHADSVLSGADANIVLQDGQILLGDGAGVEHWIRTSEFERFLLPRASAGANLPTLLNTNGNAITLASNTTVGGFRIETPTGSGLFADGITNAAVRDLEIVDAGGNGIDLRNGSGRIQFTNTSVSGGSTLDPNSFAASTAGLRVDGGNADVTYSGTIENTAGYLVAVSNTTGGEVDLRSATINGGAGGGVAIHNAGGDVTFNNLSLVGTLGDGIDIQGGNGTFQFLGQTNLSNVVGSGVSIDGLLDGGLVQFNHLWMDQRQGTGIELNNVGGSAQFLGNTVIEANSGITTAGVDFQNSSGAVTFNNIDLVGGGTGINMGSLLNESTGSFQVNGITNISSVNGPGIRIFDDSASVVFNEVEISNRTAEGILIDAGRGFVQFRDTVGVSNGLASSSGAIVIRNSTGNLHFIEANVNNATGAGGVRLEDNSGSTLFEDLNITSQNGVGLFAKNGGSLYVYDGNIQTTGASAVDLESTNLSAQFSTVSSNGGTVGMRFQGTTGTFAVTGDGTENSGGTIQGSDRAISIANSTGISMQDMLLYDNRVGIDADNAGTLLFNRFNINNSTDDAIQATNVQNLTVANSVIWNDSTAGSSSVVLDYNQSANYQLTFTGNAITSQHKDALTILGNPGSEGSTLAMTVSNNLLQTDRTGDAGIDMTWRGGTTGTISSNTFQGDDGTNTGLFINSLSTTQTLNLGISQNQFSFGGGNDIGIDVNAAGTSQLNFSQNKIDLYGANSQGMVFDLMTTNATFSNNTINGYHDVTHGILFNTISAPSNITLNGNAMNFASVNTLVHEGITFTTVNGVTASDKINLSGSQNNTINGASSNFVFPAGSINGQFQLNGVFGP
jgi:hypothetical protein